MNNHALDIENTFHHDQYNSDFNGNLNRYNNVFYLHTRIIILLTTLMAS